MSFPDDIESLQQQLTSLVGQVRMDVDVPRDALGHYFIDVVLQDRIATLLWAEGRGFGIFDPDGVGFGEKPIEIGLSSRDAACRVAEILGGQNSLLGTPVSWWFWPTIYISSMVAGFTAIFGRSSDGSSVGNHLRSHETRASQRKRG